MRMRRKRPAHQVGRVRPLIQLVRYSGGCHGFSRLLGPVDVILAKGHRPLVQTVAWLVVDEKLVYYTLILSTRIIAPDILTTSKISALASLSAVRCVILPPGSIIDGTIASISTVSSAFLDRDMPEVEDAVPFAALTPIDATPMFSTEAAIKLAKEVLLSLILEELRSLLEIISPGTFSVPSEVFTPS